MSDEGPVFILDEIKVKPGEAARFHAGFEQNYRPAAAQRGMELVNCWRHPPFQDIEELPTSFYFLWRLKDVAGWWKMRLSRKPDGTDERFEKHAYWRGVDELALSRKRVFLSNMDS